MANPNISNLLSAIEGAEGPFLNFLLNGNPAGCEFHCTRKFDVSGATGFYLEEVVEKMAESDPVHFARCVVLYLEWCFSDGCFDPAEEGAEDAGK